MKRNVIGKLSKGLRRTAMAIAASGMVAAGAVRADPGYSTVVVPPADLPEPAHQCIS
jgi:hypothetical protein